MFKKFRKQNAVLLVAALTASAFFTAPSTLTVQASPMEGNPYRNVMYYGDWSSYPEQGSFYPSGIPAEDLTHLNFAFLDFDAQGNLLFTEEELAVSAPLDLTGAKKGSPNAGLLNAITELRAENPNLKIGISIGGWSKSGDFSVMTADRTARNRFICNVLKFVEYTDMDFVDIDWEYPNDLRFPDTVDNEKDEGCPAATQADVERLSHLLASMRRALDRQGKELGKEYELSIAIPAVKKKLLNGYKLDEIFDYIDFANVMTYDLRGTWDSNSGHHTALYGNPDDPYLTYGLSIDGITQFFKKFEVPLEKLNMGCAFYSRGWAKVQEGDNPELPGLFAFTEAVGKNANDTITTGAPNELPMKVGDSGKAGGVWSYRSLDKLKELYPDIQEYWDDAAKAPYLYDKVSGAFFTYDNVRSVTEKTTYIKENGLGGMISWMASQDAPVDPESEIRNELTHAIKLGLFGEAPLLAETTARPDRTEFKTELAEGKLTLTNLEVSEETDAVLLPLETNAETIKFPVLQIKLSNGGETTLALKDSFIGQGETVTVDLTELLTEEPVTANDLPTQETFIASEDLTVTEITLEQHMVKDGPVLCSQIIYKAD